MSPSKATGCYRFGEFEFDLGAFALRRSGEVVGLQPKALDVLRYLIEHRGRMVGKGELLDELWRDEYVGDAVVTWSVSHIRRALGQQRGDKRPIETVHGRGYRFAAKVTQSDAPATAPPPPDAARVPSSTLVGREQVMAELQRHAQLAATGRGSLCVITGEAGMGKTRCGAELMTYAARHGMQTLSGRCPQELETPPLWPILSALGHLGAAHAQIATSARSMLSGTADQGVQGGRVSEGTRFFRTEQAARLLRALASERPLLLFLDDLHWADADTLRLLAFIAPELHQLPLCVVTTLRDGEQEGATHDETRLRMLRHAHLIPLGSLDRDQVVELVKNLTQHQPSPELAEAVRRATGGVPLFVQEVVRTLALEHGEEALDTLSPELVRVPPLARDLLRHRIRRLPEATIELLSRAAVIGESFDLSLLTALLDCEPDALLDRLEPACTGGQLQSEAPHSYRFVHSLFRTVLYEDLPPGQRMAVHRRIGELLASRADGTASKGSIARHYYLSLPIGGHEEVAQRAREAGDEAMRALVFEDAAVYFEWALEAQVLASTVEPATRGELMLSLATAQRSGGRTGEAMKTTKRLIEFAQQHERYDLIVRATRLRRPTMAMSSVPDGIARAALETVLQRVRDAADPAYISALSQLACLPPFENDLSRSKELSARAVEQAERAGKRESLLEALRGRLFSLSGPDDAHEALQVATRTLALDAENGGSWQGGDARVARFSTYLLLGRIADADAALAEMTAAIRGPHWGEAKFYCERLRAQRLFLDGHFAQAEEGWKVAYEGAVRAGVAYADMFRRTQMLYLAVEREGAAEVVSRTLRSLKSVQQLLPPFRANLARIAAEGGDAEFVKAQLSALGDPVDHPRDSGFLNLLACLSVCAAAVDDKPRCERLQSLLSPYAELNTPDAMGYYLGSVSYFLGLLSTTLMQWAQAARFFDCSLEHNEAMGYRAGVVRTLWAQGKLERQLGRGKRAAVRFERGLALSRELGMRGAVAELQAALATP